MADSRADHRLIQALAAVEACDRGPLEQVDMLVEMALDLQQEPKSPRQVHQAIRLYDRALELCPERERLLAARLHAGKATALRSISASGIEHLQLARAELERAIPVLRELGASPAEIADAEMSLGVVLHAMAGVRAARLTDAIAAYERANRVFDRKHYPREFAILQNNLATAYLTMPIVDEHKKQREALAVQAFTAALDVVTLRDAPLEYAMLQNNLGNALQYAASGHPLQNGLRALQAYDAALKVRNARDTPVQYANTLANKANCLRSLPDDPEHPTAGNQGRLWEAAILYAEAAPIFAGHAEFEKAQMVEQARGEVLRQLGATETPNDVGVSRDS